MTNNKLRVFQNPDQSPQSASTPEAPVAADSVKVPLGYIFAWLADAVDARKAWIHDFADDEITISTDLYDAIRTYQHFQRSTA